MIGSGFSKNAKKLRPDASELPLWPNLAWAMRNELYEGPTGNEKDYDTVNLPSIDDPLSLAQELDTAFGRNSLYRLLRQQIHDEDFYPDDEHKRLLRLPWRDIFTTNWDRLLERTLQHEPNYSVVRSILDLPHSGQPRIVKLHGSFPDQSSLIVTEEDYRTYPSKYAAFVNTVQQALMETVFCLIGFSGEDPNFKYWSSWVRDNLGAAAPKIYLAGWLGISSHRRRMLEDQGVIPIDIAHHPQASGWPPTLRHNFATRWILHSLERGQPYEAANWPSPHFVPPPGVPCDLEPVNLPSHNHPRKERWPPQPGDESENMSESIKDVLAVWEANRRVYPGWLVFPDGEERQTLKSITDQWEKQILSSFHSLTALEQVKAVRELVWRRKILLSPLSTKLESMANSLWKSIDPSNMTIDGVECPVKERTAVWEAWIEVGLYLVTTARLHFDREEFDSRIQILSMYEVEYPDIHHELKHEVCLWESYALNFEGLIELLQGWKTENCDPIWMVRKSALLRELNQDEEADDLVQEALASIKNIYGHDDVPGTSREGWTLWSTLRTNNRNRVNRRWDELAFLRCDAGLEKEKISRAIVGGGQTKSPPAFDLGFTTSTTSFSGSNWWEAPFRGVLLAERAGLPTSVVGSDILRPAAEKLAHHHSDMAIRLVLRACSSDTDHTLRRVLSRAQVALLPTETASNLIKICRQMIEHALPMLANRRGSLFPDYWVTRIGVAMEALSRLVLRATPEEAERTLDIGLRCFGSTEVRQIYVLYNALMNLLERSWKSIPVERRAGRVLDILGAPLVGLDGFTAVLSERFPDPWDVIHDDEISLTRSEENDVRWGEVINFLVRGLHEGGEARMRASYRIGSFVRRGISMTESEFSLVAEALWSEKFTGHNDLPRHTSLFDWFFLILPQPDSVNAQDIFRQKWLTISDSEESPTTDEILYTVGIALAGLRGREEYFELSEIEQDYVVGIVEQWADIPAAMHTSWRYPRTRDPVYRAVAGLSATLPTIEISESVAGKLFDKCKTLIDQTSLREEHRDEVFLLMAGLFKALPGQRDSIVSWMKMGIASQHGDLVRGAILGLRVWLIASIRWDSQLLPPDDLVREVGIIISSRRKVALPQALEVAQWIFDQGDTRYRDLVKDWIIHGLGYLEEELQYSREHELSNVEEVPQLRFLCAQLAETMRQRGFENEPTIKRWLELCASDPLPEVRYAVSLPEEGSEQGHSTAAEEQ